MYPICTSAIFLIHSFLFCRRIIPISTFAICIFTLLFPVNIRMFFCYYTPHSFFCWVPHDSEPPISFSWCLHVLVLMGRGGGGTPPCEYPLAFGNIPLMVFFGAHHFTNPGIPILPLCVLNSPLFPYRYPNVFHARFAPCSLLCMLLSTNKCPNLPLSLALQYLSTSNRERNIPPNVLPFTIVQLAEMSIL